MFAQNHTNPSKGLNQQLCRSQNRNQKLYWSRNHKSQLESESESESQKSDGVGIELRQPELESESESKRSAGVGIGVRIVIEPRSDVYDYESCPAR